MKFSWHESKILRRMGAAKLPPRKFFLMTPVFQFKRGREHFVNSNSVFRIIRTKMTGETAEYAPILSGRTG